MASRAPCTFNIGNQTSTIETLTGTNFKRWKEDIGIQLGLMDLDIVLRKDEFPKPTEQSSIDEKAKYEKWKRVNCLCLMIIKRSISHNLIGALPEIEKAKKFFDDIAEKYQVI
ncbi:Hypothetical predicted protein [Olea europaea subsp. europaea]|uniref:UBN2_3 domain-containing protein n=1 Tax=Olea europaea subsp. europaea TaxID=158383 RepID=A0A8S0STF1_OLEEU|nr:Hypothetical predicted protein [Olea europaea subsp. europaea]